MAENQGKVFIVSGPSGAGKTTVTAEALQRLQKEYDISRIITCTSREPREGEVDGKDYVFLSHDAFQTRFKENLFLETTEYGGHLYGSPRPSEQDLELGKSFVIIVDIEGAKSIAKEFRDATLVWIAPPDMTILKKRLEKRKSESASGIEKRLTKAEKEMKEAHKIRLFEYVLVNDIFEQSVEELILLVKKVLG